LKLYPIFLFITALLASSCDLIPARSESADAIATLAGFTGASYRATPFEIQTYSKGMGGQRELLTVYVEGDGRAWWRKNRLSTDPTPRNPVGLKLATRDSSPTVLYLGRPCQYLDKKALQDCDSKYWSSHRYAPEVVEAMNNVIDQFLARYPAHGIILIGYSGGGTLATLMAMKRQDVELLVTLVANLDHEAWTTYHEVTPLSGSLNARDVITQIAMIPQIHFRGDQDTVVPPDTLNYVRREFSKINLDPFRIIEGFDHTCCWVDAWPEILCQEPLSLPAYCQ
jgi:hypothetical protein